MFMAAQDVRRIDVYDAARSELEVVIETVRRLGARSHTEIERHIRSGVRGVGHCLFQSHLDGLFEDEKAAVPVWKRTAGTEIRVRRRGLENGFGRLSVRRHGVRLSGERAARFPMDAALNLPPEVYALSLRREVVEEVIGVSFDRTVERVDDTTGGHVPKRQAEQLTVRAAVDFDTFYSTRVVPDNDTLSRKALQIMSSDSTGVAMRPEALREATRKEADVAKATAGRGDPMAPRKLRRHTKRMAVVTAVWEQERSERTANDVIEALNRKTGTPKPHKQDKSKAPRPQNKRVSASVDKSQAQAIGEMFDEAQRRNPDGARDNVVLIDGEEHQKELIQNEAHARKLDVTIVLDIIHVIHYLWLIAVVICRKDETLSEEWVAHTLMQLLTSDPMHVVGTIRQTATKRGIQGDERIAIDKAVQYLRRNSPFIHYARFLALGFPIATGVIEGTCRHLVKDRLAITGACWGLATAEAVLKLRALRSSGDWDDYWPFHERQEQARNHPAITKVG